MNGGLTAQRLADPPANSALQTIGVTTLAEIAKLGQPELLSMHGVGPKAVRILGEAMEGRGIEFAG